MKKRIHNKEQKMKSFKKRWAGHYIKESCNPIPQRPFIHGHSNNNEKENTQPRKEIDDDCGAD